MPLAFQMGLFGPDATDPLITLSPPKESPVMVDEHGTSPLLSSDGISRHYSATPGSMAACMTYRTRVVLVGPSIRFLSGISYYTIRLSDALSESTDVKAILFRHMLPKKIFPGWKRVGDELSMASFRADVKVNEVLDWYNPISWMSAASQMRDADVIIFQWWTSSVAHMYLALQLMLFRKVPIVIEYHEVVDPLEQSIMPIRVYSTLMGSIIRRFADQFVVHSKADRTLIEQSYHIRRERVAVIPHGLYDQYPVIEKPAARKHLGITEENVILFFGLLRPYKGVKYLIEAFDALPQNLIHSTRLLIVGEAWEDRESLIRADESPYKEKISIVNRYIGDDEIPLYFSAADLVALPYTRASQSGVAHIAMSYGLPIIATKVGGLEEGLHEYAGAFFIPPNNSENLKDELIRCIERKGSFAPPANLAWSEIGKQWTSLLNSVIRHEATTLKKGT
jgi:glycosyltransferase involved in cell wall biosynthesis